MQKNKSGCFSSEHSAYFSVYSCVTMVHRSRSVLHLTLLIVCTLLHLRQQGAGIGSRTACSRPRQRPVLFEAKAKNSIFETKAKASDHNC